MRDEHVVDSSMLGGDGFPNTSLVLVEHGYIIAKIVKIWVGKGSGEKWVGKGGVVIRCVIALRWDGS